MKNLWVLGLFLSAALAANAQTKPASAKSGSAVVSARPMPTMTQQLTWLGFGAPWYGEPPPGAAPLTNFGVGWARGTFGYNSTNTDTFAWRCVQHGGPNSWDWIRADSEINYLQRFPWKFVVLLSQGGDDPLWARTLSTNDYVAAKATFINALAEHYAGKIWGIEVENEPRPDLQDVHDKPDSWAGYQRHLALLQACQPARQYCKLVGWACQGSFQRWFTYMVQNGLTNLCDAVSWHMYGHQYQPPDVTMAESPGDDSYSGRLDQWMQWMRAQVGNMPILVTELGLEPAAPMRMAKVLIMLRAYNADCIQLWIWGGGSAPGEFAAFDSRTGNLFPHTVIAVWTAYWLGNDSLVSQTVDNNTFVFSFSNRTFVWCLEGTLRSYTASGWTSITDIYGNKTTPIVLTDAVTVFNGTGSLILSNSPSWRVLRSQ